MLNEKLSEGLALVGTLDPQTVANSETFTDWVDVSEFKKILATLSLGDMANETIDFAMYQATDGSGTGSKALRAATQLAADASANDNTQVCIEVDNTDLDDAGGFTHVRCGVVTGGATGGPVSVLVQGGHAYNGPASGQNLASVQEIKSA